MLRKTVLPCLAYLLFTCFICTPGQAQKADVVPSRLDATKIEQLENLLDQLHEDRKFSGTVLIADRGQIVFEKSVGFSNIHDKTAFDKTASFRLASVSKQFTAMAIMMLAEDGKLNLDDNIQTHLPEIPYNDITIRHLLHHTGGIVDYMGLFIRHWDTKTKIPDRKLAFNSDIVSLLAEHKPRQKFSPGEKFEYSNTGYALLGAIIEAAAGKSAGEFLGERIFVPSKMEHSQVYRYGDDFGQPHRVHGFFYERTESGPNGDNDRHFLNGVFGDGGVYASARDLLKWDQALYSGELVSQSMLSQAVTSGTLNNGEKTNYGFGWIIKPGDEVRTVTHSGGWVGFRTFISRDIIDQTVTIVLSNNSTPAIGKVIEATNSVQGSARKNPQP